MRSISPVPEPITEDESRASRTSDLYSSIGYSALFSGIAFLFSNTLKTWIVVALLTLVTYLLARTASKNAEAKIEEIEKHDDRLRAQIERLDREVDEGELDRVRRLLTELDASIDGVAERYLTEEYVHWVEESKERLETD